MSLMLTDKDVLLHTTFHHREYHDHVGAESIRDPRKWRCKLDLIGSSLRLGSEQPFQSSGCFRLALE